MYTKIANRGNYLKAGRQKSDIKYIVVHYTANNGDTARNNLDYYAREIVKTSAHYFVDENEVCCSVAWDDVAWHCGGGVYKGTTPKHYAACRNLNSIGVEMCSRKDAAGAYYFKDEVILRTAVFVAQLMEDYNIPIERVIRHYDVTGKPCPRPFIDEKAWAAFKNLVLEQRKEKEVDTVENEVVYKKIEEIPAGEFRETIRELITLGVVKGTGTGLNLTYDMVRMLVFMRRMITAYK